MIRLAISVEGPTEEEFTKQVLTEHLRANGVEPTPILLGRARGPHGGGNVSEELVVSEMAHLLHSFEAVSSLVDFYGFRGKKDRTVDDLEESMTRTLRPRLTGHWSNRAVIPYIQQYEFEGLLFSKVDVFERLVDVPKGAAETLSRARREFPTPEDINDSPHTAPSKRILSAMPRYRKRVHGPLLAGQIGLATLRAECRRFDDWVSRLELLGGRDRAGERQIDRPEGNC